MQYDELKNTSIISTPSTQDTSPLLAIPPPPYMKTKLKIIECLEHTFKIL